MFVVLSCVLGAPLLAHSKSKQQTCVERSLGYAINFDPDIDEGIWRYLLSNGATKDDCCSWRGFECVDGLLQSLAMTTFGLDERRWYLDLDWLPSSIENIFCKSVFLVRRFSVERLPRSLRYFYIFQQSGCLYPSPQGVLHLCHLPMHMEEFRMITWNAFCGVVLIHEVPKTMRVCVLTNPCISTVIVSNEGLPPSLELIKIHGAKVICIDSKKADKRIQTNYHGSKHAELSETSKKFIDLCINIERESCGDYA